MKSNKEIFNSIRYANVWEDADLLCTALSPSASQGRILSIASSGDNVLALLTLDPKEIVAVDFSAPQLACLALRIAAFQTLDYTEMCKFLGLLPSCNRLETYQNRLRRQLKPEAAAFWDEKLPSLQRGIIHAGKFERYLRLFGQWVLPLVQSRRAIQELLREKSREERHQFYNERWNHWRWRLLFKVFFSRFVMGRAGRDPSFFQHVEGSVGERILLRSRHALTELATHQNPFLHYILQGNFPLENPPRYLRREYYDQIRERVDRIHLHQGSATSVEGSFDAFNLSDIFEYMSSEMAAACYEKLLRQAKPGARLAYWNLLALRSCPAHCLDRVFPLTELSHSLHQQDRAWFYQKFVVEQCR